MVLRRMGAAEPDPTVEGNDPLLRLADTWSQEEADLWSCALRPIALDTVRSSCW